MSINKVVYDGNTLIDLTEDTVEPSALASGYTAHDRSGATITGTYTQAQANWTETNENSPSYIQNKPNLTKSYLMLVNENDETKISLYQGNSTNGIAIFKPSDLYNNYASIGADDTTGGFISIRNISPSPNNYLDRIYITPTTINFMESDPNAQYGASMAYQGSFSASGGLNISHRLDTVFTEYEYLKLTYDECTLGTHKISHGNIFSTTITPTAADLNDFKTGGLYHRISDISQLANCPTGSSFMMEVFAPNTSLIYQRITDYNITSNTSEVYVRVYRDATSSWSAWKRLASMDTLSPVDISSYLPTGVSAVSNQGGCYYVVRNGQVHVHIAVSGLTANTNTNIASAIPSALRPSTVITGVGFAGALATEAMSKAVLNNANGTITINSTTTSARIDFSYMI